MTCVFQRLGVDVIGVFSVAGVDCHVRGLVEIELVQCITQPLLIELAGGILDGD
ncbi:hypothetical protein [Glutamicibacter sp.]|uniref:hypothetical protein n=1 Tax=Glutamicibacter sp. TaxID=1931995 RepID=UPI002FC68E29